MRYALCFNVTNRAMVCVNHMDLESDIAISSPRADEPWSYLSWFRIPGTRSFSYFGAWNGMTCQQVENCSQFYEIEKLIRYSIENRVKFTWARITRAFCWDEIVKYSQKSRGLLRRMFRVCQSCRMRIGYFFSKCWSSPFFGRTYSG